MTLIAYRPEYRIYLDETDNHLTFERLEELTLALDLPHYLSDMQRAVKRVQLGFTMLCDLRCTLGPNLLLLPLFHSGRQLLQKAGISMLVELHPAAPTMQQLSRLLREESPIPVRQFTDPAEAAVFLSRFRLRMAC
ncbi:MAG TPA: hypothetical protein VK364_03060 [Hymenobacter sp.]|nr:hypothetical protein [Hymenobacter sp.]